MNDNCGAPAYRDTMLLIGGELGEAAARERIPVLNPGTEKQMTIHKPEWRPTMQIVCEKNPSEYRRRHRCKRAVLAIGLLSGAATAGIAQTAVPSTVVDRTASDSAGRHITGKELGGILRKGKTPDALYAQVLLSKHDAYLIDDMTRYKSGLAEIHESWDDNIFIQDGVARFVVGGAAVDAKVTAPGEKRGTSITGGTTMITGPGDYLFIPAGTPHQMFVDPGKPVKFIHFKARRQ